MNGDEEHAPVWTFLGKASFRSQLCAHIADAYLDEFDRHHATNPMDAVLDLKWNTKKRRKLFLRVRTAATEYKCTSTITPYADDHSLQEVLSLMHLYSPLLGQNLNLASILPIEGALKVDLHYLWKVLMQGFTDEKSGTMGSDFYEHISRGIYHYLIPGISNSASRKLAEAMVGIDSGGQVHSLQGDLQMTEDQFYNMMLDLAGAWVETTSEQETSAFVSFIAKCLLTPEHWAVHFGERSEQQKKVDTFASPRSPLSPTHPLQSPHGSDMPPRTFSTEGAHERAERLAHLAVKIKEDGAPLDGVRLWKKNAASSLMHRLSDQNHADVHYHTFKMHTQAAPISVVAPTLASIRPVAPHTESDQHAFKPQDLNVLQAVIYVPSDPSASHQQPHPHEPRMRSASPLYMSALRSSTNKSKIRPQMNKMMKRHSMMGMTMSTAMGNTMGSTMGNTMGSTMGNAMGSRGTGMGRSVSPMRQAATPPPRSWGTTPYDYMQPHLEGSVPPTSLFGTAADSGSHLIAQSILEHPNSTHQALGHELFPTSSNMFPMDERLKYFAATGQAPPTDFGPGHDNMFLTVRPTSGPGVSGGQPTALFTGTGTIGDGGLAGGTIGTNASATWGARSPDVFGMKTHQRKPPPVPLTHGAKVAFDSRTYTYGGGQSSAPKDLSKLPEVNSTGAEFIAYIQKGGYDPINPPSVMGSSNYIPVHPSSKLLDLRSKADVKRKKAIALWPTVDTRLHSMLVNNSEEKAAEKTPATRKSKATVNARVFDKVPEPRPEDWQPKGYEKVWLLDQKTEGSFKAHKNQRIRNAEKYTEKNCEIDKKREGVMQRVTRRRSPQSPEELDQDHSPEEDTGCQAINAVKDVAGGKREAASATHSPTIELSLHADVGSDDNSNADYPDERDLPSPIPVPAAKRPKALYPVDRAAASPKIHRRGGSLGDTYKPYDYTSLLKTEPETKMDLKLSVASQSPSFEENMAMLDKHKSRFQCMSKVLMTDDNVDSKHSPAVGGRPSIGGRLKAKDNFYHKHDRKTDSSDVHIRQLSNTLRPADMGVEFTSEGSL